MTTQSVAEDTGWGQRWTAEMTPEKGMLVYLLDNRSLPSIPQFAPGRVERVGVIKATGETAVDVRFHHAPGIKTYWTQAAARALEFKRVGE